MRLETPSRVLRALALPGALIVLCCTSARAEGPEATLAPSPALTCLAPAADVRGKPAYPEEALKTKEAATLHVRLVFRGPDRAPEIFFDDRSLHPLIGDDAPRNDFEKSVVAYAQPLRVPCMKDGDAPVTLRQDFVFTPNDGRKVVWTAMSDDADRVREQQLQCLKSPTGSDAEIRYPGRAMMERHEGIVMVRLHFSSDAAPSMTVLDDGGDPSFVRAIRSYVSAMRLPCAGTDPVDVHMKFAFRIAGLPHVRYYLKDTDLGGYVRLAAPASVGSVYFDTRTMKCPFDVRIKYRQPFESNIVSELEADVPERHALLDWIARLQPSIGNTQPKELFGQSMVVHVPCARIDL